MSRGALFMWLSFPPVLPRLETYEKLKVAREGQRKDKAKN
jgi:hypothetical protein